MCAVISVIFKTQRLTRPTRNTATVSRLVVDCMWDVNRIICHFPPCLYLELCFCYSVCIIVFVSFYKCKIYQSSGHSPECASPGKNSTQKIYTSPTLGPTQLQSENVYLTKLLQCKLCWTASSEPWPHAWFPLQLSVEIYFSFCQFVVGMGHLHYSMKYQKPSVCTTCKYCVYLSRLWWHVCVHMCVWICSCPDCTVDCQTETNHLAVLVIAYSGTNFSVAIRAELTIIKIHCWTFPLFNCDHCY